MPGIEYYAVYNESNLGYLFIDSDGKQRFGILRASILRGSSFNELSDPLYISPVYTLRKATEQDFEDYRVSIPPDFFNYQKL